MYQTGHKGTTRNFKVVILGETGVGKTSLASRLTGKAIPKEHTPTIGLDFTLSSMRVDGTLVRTMVWDTAGQERFHSLLPAYCRSARGAIFMFDLTDWQSFSKLDQCLQQALVTLPDDVCKMLLGNKRDLAEEGQRNVPSIIAVEWAKRVGARYIEISALHDKDIKETLRYLARDMLARNPMLEDDLAISSLSHNQKSRESKCCL